MGEAAVGEADHYTEGIVTKLSLHHELSGFAELSHIAVQIHSLDVIVDKGLDIGTSLLVVHDVAHSGVGVCTEGQSLLGYHSNGLAQPNVTG